MSAHPMADKVLHSLLLADVENGFSPEQADRQPQVPFQPASSEASPPEEEAEGESVSRFEAELHGFLLALAQFDHHYFQFQRQRAVARSKQNAAFLDAKVSDNH